MREILFRAKKKLGGSWCEGFLVKTGDHFRISTQNDLISFGVYPETVGQYTGLTDMNGVKIFEDDIVSISGHSEPVNGLYRVVYSTANHCWVLKRSLEYRHCYFSFSDLNGFADDAEIVGNIHDNPELLNKAENSAIDSPPEKP